ncbi:sterol desaturase family protein [Psychroflexus halocasei]|uniref:Beta-carotene 3-hydroxylase n=1 Tax=Psychroflexus halocasei TaxID=908615 RepID=A0A1H4AZS5_9FLAO|nr:sterol desaturase family protein [Psychroflexus halocasei]SEA41336.1 beta-carotene 3-hydroxylase [Psychroflexus halocasei]
MKIFLLILTFLSTFCFMEFMAWFSHKYIMHGFGWFLHKDHHMKDHDSWWERNDFYFVFYAFISMSLFISLNPYAIAVGAGIAAYGLAYFLVHDIFIHQRFKMFRNANNWYARGIRRAHKMHHKHLGKEDSECFGMLFPPLKYFKRELKNAKKKA